MTQPLSAFGLPSDVLLWQALLLTLLSYGVGVLGGFVGLALGTVRLPALLFLGMPVVLAGGTNLLVSTASAVAGSVHHFRAGRVDHELVFWIGTPSVAGAALGGVFASFADEGLLLTVIGAFVLWQGVEFMGLARRRAERSPTRLAGPRKLIEVLIGFVIGVLSGAAGLILGSVRLPALVRVLGVEPRLAAGTNLFIGILTGIAGFLGHAALGAVDYPLLALLAAGGIVGQLQGARLTGRASADVLLMIMGIVLGAVGVLLLGDGVARLLQ